MIPYFKNNNVQFFDQCLYMNLFNAKRMQNVVEHLEYFGSIKMHPISPFVSLLSLPCAGDSPVSDTSFDSGASTTSQTPQIEKEILCLTHCA